MNDEPENSAALLYGKMRAEGAAIQQTCVISRLRVLPT